ncbi:Uncharacterised protein [Leminorella richardii]|uniref:N-acetyltransferase domain-containing protein n=1 Tax=Leminorella richardii TaxID=158841 RepID=A0A2X4UYS0_9GAMM|nr:hypothetical protein [Leminorella richardii]SQI40968.1 Uncharacterised protein [Leminorella richardii]
MSAQNELNQLNEKADPIRYLRATLEDYADILTVAEPFYPESNGQNQDRGFLDKRFTAPMLASINDRLGLLIAKDQNQTLLGFLGLSPFSAGSPSPVVDAMLKALSISRAPLPFIFGPVCVAESASGRGVFKGLYAEMWHFLPSTLYQTGFAFINEKNQKSLDVHRNALGAEVVDSFSHSSERYFVIRYIRPA